MGATLEEVGLVGSDGLHRAVVDLSRLFFVDNHAEGYVVEYSAWESLSFLLPMQRKNQAIVC